MLELTITGETVEELVSKIVGLAALLTTGAQALSAQAKAMARMVEEAAQATEAK